MKAKTILVAAIIACAAILIPPFYACTGITLTALDGAVVYGRTMEWGSFGAAFVCAAPSIPVGHCSMPAFVLRFLVGIAAEVPLTRSHR
jgi:hypothetical protein